MDSKRFRRIRVNAGLSQCQLAHYLGYSNRFRISEIENGHREIQYHTKLMMEILKAGMEKDIIYIPIELRRKLELRVALLEEE